MKNTKKTTEVFAALRQQKSAAVKRFSITQTVITPKAHARLHKFGFTATELVARHQAGDWGVATDMEKRRNEQALHNGTNLTSIYRLVAAPWLQSVPRNERARLPTVWVQSNVVNRTGKRQVTILCPEEL